MGMTNEKFVDAAGIRNWYFEKGAGEILGGQESGIGVRLSTLDNFFPCIELYDATVRFYGKCQREKGACKSSRSGLGKLRYRFVKVGLLPISAR